MSENRNSMKRSMKNSIYTLPLLLLCFVSLTSFSISWPQFNEWKPSTWFRLPTQQDLPVWMQAFVNKIKQFLGQKETNIESEKSKIIYNMLDKHKFIPEQIKFLEAQENNYRRTNNDDMQTFVSNLKGEMQEFVTAKDWIAFLEEQKDIFKGNTQIEQKLNNFINTINQNIVSQKNAIQATYSPFLNQLKRKEGFTRFLKNQYTNYTKQQKPFFSSEFYYQDPLINLEALNIFVIDLLKQNKINNIDIYKISYEFTKEDNEKGHLGLYFKHSLFLNYPNNQKNQNK